MIFADFLVFPPYGVSLRLKIEGTMSPTITTRHHGYTLSVLQRMADDVNCTKEELIERVVWNSVNAFAQLESDIRDARDAVKTGRCYTDEQVTDYLKRLGIDVS